jgi:hypothetical protein
MPTSGMPTPGATTMPAPSDFVPAPRGGTDVAGSLRPNLFGDQGGGGACDPFIAVLHADGTRTPVTTGTVFVVRPGDKQLLASGRTVDISSLAGQTLVAEPCTGAKIPLATTARGAFKITENESPRPQDRVYTTYNFFDNVGGSTAPPGFPQTDIHREVIGAEKTFFGGNGSVGLRLPFVQVEGDGSIRRSDVGDLSVVTKYALINNCDTGNVLSAGLVVTAPTGNSFLTEGVPDIHPWILQPFVGYIYGLTDNLYVQGFSSIAVPTDERDVTYWFNDFAIGYVIYRADSCSDNWITSVTPIFEVHVNTPLNHRGSDVDPIGGVDIVDLTFGATVGIRHRAYLNLGVVTPATGPKPFDVEGQVQLNLRF